MKLKRCFGLVLVLAIMVGSFGASSLAIETQGNNPISDIERASGSFSTTISAGKYKTIGSAISLAAGENVNFNATYSPRSVSVDFGVVDSNNVFTYITSSNGSVDGGVTIEVSGQYTPAIRNNSSSNSITVSGTIECVRMVTE